MSEKPWGRKKTLDNAVTEPSTMLSRVFFFCGPNSAERSASLQEKLSNNAGLHLFEALNKGRGGLGDGVGTKGVSGLVEEGRLTLSPNEGWEAFCLMCGMEGESAAACHFNEKSKSLIESRFDSQVLFLFLFTQGNVRDP